MERGLERLLERYLPVCLAVALFTLTWVGVDSPRVTCMLGVLLCALGLVQRPARADLWTLVPLGIYAAAGLFSARLAYGSFAATYPVTRLIFPVLCLLTACLEDGELSLVRRLGALWAAVTAGAGVMQFVWHVLSTGSAVRLGGFLGNPNALGIFLVIGWFALLRCGRFSRLEPVVLAALALTLSMGSFLAMAAGVCCLLWEKQRQDGWAAAYRSGCVLLAKAALGMGAGLLLYLAAARSGMPWLCVAVSAYLLASALCWDALDRYLAARPRTAAFFTALGVVVAGAAAMVRPSAAATFAERLAMMRNGLGYLTQDPLLGVGPYQWRLLNLADSDTYYNTWHIHNALLHVGVELGWPAMLALAAGAVRLFRKTRDPYRRAGFAAFCCHNLMDTSFFYMGILALTLLTCGEPRLRGRTLPGAVQRAAFGGCGVLFLYFLYHNLRFG